MDEAACAERRIGPGARVGEAPASAPLADPVGPPDLGAVEPTEQEMPVTSTPSMRRRPDPVSGLVLALTLLSLPLALTAQSGADSIQSPAQRGIDRIEPSIAAPGATVTVSSEEMPSMTGLRLGLGAANVGFEELTDFVTSEGGAFSETVTVPAWAERDRVHRFIVFDLYFRPIALSGPFHVTDAEGLVEREGRVQTGPGCPQLVDVDEVAYALEGATEALPAPGASVTLVGRVREGSTCGLDFTLEVVR
jgi:hypothetical protein